MSKKRVRQKDGEHSNKYGVFELFLDDPEGFDPELAHKKYPAVKLSTIKSWESRWRNWDRDSFTGTDGFPRGSADTPEKIARIKDAISRARSARGTGRHGDAKRKITRPEYNFAGELTSNEAYIEGAVSQVLVNRYERDPRAREVCIQKFGCTCTVCGFNFRDRYGKIGDRFIHVHHLKPLALRKSKYRLNPVVDLAPVCPNCHAMLHTADPPLEIDELRKIWLEHRRT